MRQTCGALALAGLGMLGVAIAVAGGTAAGAAGVNAVRNPGFESGALREWRSCGDVAAHVSMRAAHAGRYAARMGSTTQHSGEISGDAAICQTVAVPADGVLRFWAYQFSSERDARASWQQADILDTAGNSLVTLYRTSATTGRWVRHAYELEEYAGRTVQLYFGVHGDGSRAGATIQYIDDVAVSAQPQPPLPVPAPGTPAGMPTPPLLPTPSAAPSGACANDRCGTERWAVKTLSDPQAAAVNFTPLPATIAQLRAAPYPTGPPTTALPDSHRFGPTELQVYTIRASILAYKMETDRDIHLAVFDPADPALTMIAEFPSDACSGVCSSAYRGIMRDARTAIEACIGTPTASYQTPAHPILADITGVGFFDRVHDQRGVSVSNGIELHPVLHVSIVSGSCR